MEKRENLALQVTKEIVVKFVETGRISPGNFTEHFGPIYEEVLRVISRTPHAPGQTDAAPAKGGHDHG
ncbi:hypothetical protein GTA51_06930 [Desulfovibrio aerotolerans]|uniref:Conjugal transfer protein TraB n=1 Tax=Solidesulfovibrio aerotolerans TaxID=295255 RepID=A0A7C9MES0_9BACT|nr:hypothetical protein [Solidesulfovibrio aerotolerans]MYL82870.1 hypothetical protein [Solidesulfovibrio aerotolerans]